jgi:hypothetical protein
MLNYAGEVLLALGLVLSSLLTYWLVWKHNGLGKVPEPQSNLKQEKECNEPGIMKQNQGDLRHRCPRPRRKDRVAGILQPPLAEELGVCVICFTDAPAEG